MATESEIEKYRTLLTDSNIEKLKSIKQTYINQISQAKTDLGKASFTDWEDLVSSKFKLHYENLKTGYSTIETDVGDGSNLDILITLVKGLKTKCEEYHRYQEEYNSIKTGVSFSNKELSEEYNAYKSGRKSYSQLSQGVKNAISTAKANERRKNELSQLMIACSSTIDKTLKNIKLITFNASSEETANISTTFGDEVVTITEQPEEDYSDTDGGKHLSNEEALQHYQDCRQTLDNLIAKLKEISLLSPEEAFKAINGLYPDVLNVLREYSDALALIYLKGEISYNEYVTLSNPLNMTASDGMLFDSGYQFLEAYSSGQNFNDLVTWYNHNDDYRRFIDRLNQDGCSGQEFFKNLPPLSYYDQDGIEIDYNDKETASKYVSAAVVELIENGFTGDVIQDYVNEIISGFNNKAGDRMFEQGYADLGKAIINRNWSSYNSNGGAFNANQEAPTQEGRAEKPTSGKGIAIHKTSTGSESGGGTGTHF